MCVNHYVNSVHDVMECVLQTRSRVCKQVVCAFVALWLPHFGAGVFVCWYIGEEFYLFEFPNKGNRMPISMQEFGENSCMNEIFDGLKRKLSIPFFPTCYKLTASLTNPRAPGLVVDQLRKRPPLEARQ